jgi:hypothetical protein
MRWLNAGISALVAYVFIRLFNPPLTGAAVVFLVVFVVLNLTGSSFGGIWNSGLWTTLPAAASWVQSQMPPSSSQPLWLRGG